VIAKAFGIKISPNHFRSEENHESERLRRAVESKVNTAGISPHSRVIVSELVPAVIDWNRGPLASPARRPLEDRRIEVRSGSVIDILSVSQHSFDGIILDVDNGPEAVLYRPNRFLYSAGGLELVKGALAVDGAIGVWSADRSIAFENALSDAGFKWRRVAVDARGNDGGPEHTIYIARAGLEAG
jgi:spermidine synthase